MITGAIKITYKLIIIFFLDVINKYLQVLIENYTFDEWTVTNAKHVAVSNKLISFIQQVDRLTQQTAQYFIKGT